MLFKTCRHNSGQITSCLTRHNGVMQPFNSHHNTRASCIQAQLCMLEQGRARSSRDQLQAVVVHEELALAARLLVGASAASRLSMLGRIVASRLSCNGLREVAVQRPCEAAGLLLGAIALMPAVGHERKCSKE